MAATLKRQKPGPKGIPEHKVKNALTKHAGVYALAARELGVDRSTVCNRVARSVVLQEHVATLRATVMDAAEGVIFQAIMKNDVATARWFADRHGKDRGYSTRQEHTGADGSPLPAPTVQVVVTYADPKDDVI